MRFITFAFVAFSLWQPSLLAQKPVTATSNQITATLESADAFLPTPYRVKITFTEDVPFSTINRHMFLIREKGSREGVQIVAMHRVGATDTNASVDVIRSLVIYAHFDPTLAYTIDISQQNRPLTTVEVAPITKPTNTNSAWLPPINLDAKFFHLQITPFVATSGSTGGGLQYDAKYSLKNYYLWSGLLQANVESHGIFELAGPSSTTNAIANSLNGGLNATYQYDVPCNVWLGNETRKYVYPFGFKVAPAQFEFNKQFTLVDYTAKVLGGGALPYADYPALLWSKWFHLDVPFAAPTIFSGFVYLDNVKNNGTDPLAKLGHERWDTEILYDFPLHNQLDFRFAWHSYVGLDKRNWNSDVEIGGIIYIDQKRSQGVTITYESGSLPPAFIHTSSWKWGYTTTL